jgi:hypothetical protein
MKWYRYSGRPKQENANEQNKLRALCEVFDYSFGSH